MSSKPTPPTLTAHAPKLAARSPHPGTDTPDGAGLTDAGVLARIVAGARPTRLRAGQSLAVEQAPADTLHALVTGTLVLEARLALDRRQILVLLHPGDVFWSSIVPPHPGIAITAVTPADIVRLGQGDVDRRIAADAALLKTLRACGTRLVACMSLHEAVLGRLLGRERVASFLIEMIARLGRQTPGGVVIDIPLTREDIADYLALNPDTLSRLLSQMRAEGLVAMPTRHRWVVPDPAAVARDCPFAQALRTLHSRDKAAGPQFEAS